MSIFCADGAPKVYRITGPQSIERLEPLVARLDGSWRAFEQATSNARIDLVWETTCEKTMKRYHDTAIVFNKLHNCQIIESKSNLAYLQRRMKRPTLTTFIALGVKGVERFCQRWQGDSDDSDWWAVKVSNGNGGRDVWIMNKDNYTQVLNELPHCEELVIQKYVQKPLLWRAAKKFHFRCYSVLFAALRDSLVYQNCFLLTAGLDFDIQSTDIRKHVTNLSINKRFPNHPGQITCHLPSEYPSVYSQIQDIWSDVTQAALPFMSQQKNPNNFDFYGIDIIADECGGCWLIEANRLPGLESSSNNKVEEDRMYDDMMMSLLTIVTAPLTGKTLSRADYGLWDIVSSYDNTSSIFVNTASSDTWKNTFSWKAFTMKNRDIVLDN